MANRMISWINIVEANLTELLTFERQLLFQNETVSTADIQSQLFYVQVMVSYLRQDTLRLQNIVTHASPLFDTSIHFLAQLRLELRQAQLNESQWQDRLVKVQELNLKAIFLSEAQFVIASGLLFSGQFQSAEETFKLSAQGFHQAGALKKALRAELSALVSVSCFNPKLRLFYEYLDLVYRCISAEEFLSAGTAFLNISREFQILGAREVALSYADRAINLLGKHAIGSREHGLALVHKSQIQLELNYKFEGRESLLFALSIGNKEVQSACKILMEKYDLNFESIPSDQILPTWRERLQDTSSAQLGKLEEKLLELLSTGSKDKFELMDAIYGNLIDYDSKEGRFKNLLNRVRTRFPDLIRFKDQKYFLSEVERKLS